MATLPRMEPAKLLRSCHFKWPLSGPARSAANLTHPYLRRRKDPTQISYLLPELETHTKNGHWGVPLFQEQMLRIAMVVADFDGKPSRGNCVRAISFHRSHERMDKVVVKLREKHDQKGEIAANIQEEIVNALALLLPSTVFPESHAISFALLAYASLLAQGSSRGGILLRLAQQPADGAFYSPSHVGQGRSAAWREIPHRVRDPFPAQLPDRGRRGPSGLGLHYIQGLHRSKGGRNCAPARACAFFPIFVIFSPRIPTQQS